MGRKERKLGGNSHNGLSKDPVNLRMALEILGVSRDTVVRYVKAGMPCIQAGGRGKEWLFDPKLIRGWKEQQAMGSGTSTVGADTYEDARARKMAAEASRKEIELAQIKGSLVEIALVHDTWASILTNVKKQLLGVPSQVSPILTNIDTPREIEHLLRERIEQVLTELSEAEYAPTSTLNE